MLRATGWEAEIAAAYASIPSEYKGYVVIAKRSKNSIEKQDPAVIVTAQDLFEEFVLKHQKPAVSSLPTKNVG